MTMAPTTIQSDPTGTIKHEAVERALHDMWEELEKSDNEATVQVRTLNLLVYAPEPTEETWRRITGVAVQHPGRTITLVPGEGQARAEVSIAGRVGESVSARGEQIVLRGGGANGEGLHSLALALLQPGLPIALWWIGGPAFEGRPFLPLSEAADHVLVDSRTWTTPVVTLRELQAIRTRRMGTLRFSDLQWVSLTPWRQLIAQAFDAHNAILMLPSVTGVIVDYGGRRHIVGALLLAGWLMTRLGWKVDAEAAIRDETGLIVPLRSADRTITVAIRAHGEDDGIRGMSMECDGDPPGRLILQEKADGLNVETIIELPKVPPLHRVTHLRRMSTTVQIAEELAQNHEDPVFTATLDAVINLCDKLGSLL